MYANINKNYLIGKYFNASFTKSMTQRNSQMQMQIKNFKYWKNLSLEMKGIGITLGKTQ